MWVGRRWLEMKRNDKQILWKKCENRIKIDAAVNQDYCIGSNLNCIDEQVKSNNTTKSVWVIERERQRDRERGRER